VNQPKELILAIAANNKALHVGPLADVGAHFVGLKPDNDPPPGPGPGRFVDPTLGDVGVFIDPIPDDWPRPIRWDFFDSTGRVLTRAQVEHPGTFTPTDPTVPDEVVDEQLILLRIARALGYCQALLDANPAIGEIAPGVFVTEVPHPRGTLAEVMDELAPDFGRLDPHQMGNRGGWLHMLAHAAGIAH
jgi:hypothetical protein